MPVGFAWLLVAWLVPPLGAWLAPAPEAAAQLLLTVVQAAADAAGPATSPAIPLSLALLATGCVLAVIASRRLRVAAAVGAAALALVVALDRGPDGSLRAAVLDVGHGDAIAVTMPDGARMLVDTGGTWQGERQNRAIADRAV